MYTDDASPWQRRWLHGVAIYVSLAALRHSIHTPCLSSDSHLNFTVKVCFRIPAAKRKKEKKDKTFRSLGLDRTAHQFSPQNRRK